MSVAARLPANAAIRPNMPLPTRKRTSPVAKNAVIPRHAAKKDDWKQFFQGNNEFKDSEPDFSEEGWAKRTPKKK